MEIHFAKIGFLDSKWSNLNAPGSDAPWCHPLFGSSVGCPFPLHAGKGKCCMWPVNKVEIHFAKIGFLYSKWCNLNASGSSPPWCHPHYLLTSQPHAAFPSSCKLLYFCVSSAPHPDCQTFALIRGGEGASWAAGWGGRKESLFPVYLRARDVWLMLIV